MKTVRYTTDRIRTSVLILQIIELLNTRFGGFLPFMDVPKLQPIRVGVIRPGLGM